MNHGRAMCFKNSLHFKRSSMAILRLPHTLTLSGSDGMEINNTLSPIGLIDVCHGVSVFVSGAPPLLCTNWYRLWRRSESQKKPQIAAVYERTSAFEPTIDANAPRIHLPRQKLNGHFNFNRNSHKPNVNKQYRRQSAVGNRSSG